MSKRFEVDALERMALAYERLASEPRARRIGWLTEEADASLLRVIVNLLTP